MNTPGNNKRLLIVTDVGLDKIFIQTFEDEFGLKPAILCSELSTVKKRSQKLKRHFRYLYLAVKTLMSFKEYHYIVFYQQFIAFYYGFLTKICFLKKNFPVSLTLGVVYKARKGFFGKIYKVFFNFLLDSPGLNFFVCYGSGEQDFFTREFGVVFKDRVASIPYGLGMPEEIEYKDFGGTAERYFFSGGTSNRDYRTLLEAFRGVDERLKIICYPNDVKGFDIPPNVEVFHNVSRDDFLKYLKNAYGIILPLDNPTVSSGHIVLLDAMKLKTPIIVTRGENVEGYVDTNCALLVEPHSVEEMQKAVMDLASAEERAHTLAYNARLKYENDHTIEKHSKKIVQVLKEKFKWTFR